MRAANYLFPVLLTLLAPVEAAELTVVARNVHGTPLANAVVTLASGITHPAAQSGVVIDQQGKQFQPWVAAIEKGGTVTFSNHDDITHHIYSFSPARRFSFRLQSGEKAEPLVFDEPGIVVLGCNIHDWMVGYVHVGDGNYSMVTDMNGIARFADIPAGQWHVSLWHPGLVTGALPPVDPIDLTAAPHSLEIRLQRALTETGPRKPLDDSAYALP